MSVRDCNKQRTLTKNNEVSQKMTNLVQINIFGSNNNVFIGVIIRMLL